MAWISAKVRETVNRAGGAWGISRELENFAMLNTGWIFAPVVLVRETLLLRSFSLHPNDGAWLDLSAAGSPYSKQELQRVKQWIALCKELGSLCIVPL